MIQTAKITAVEGDNITCTIECGAACAACSAKGVCGSGEQKTINLIDISRTRSVGDTVQLEVSTKTGLKAISIAYLIPSVLIIASLIITKSAGLAELWQGLITLFTVGLYYVAIKIFGFGKTISITIIDK